MLLTLFLGRKKQFSGLNEAVTEMIAQEKGFEYFRRRGALRQEHAARLKLVMNFVHPYPSYIAIVFGMCKKISLCAGIPVEHVWGSFKKRFL
jgi:hypothetical protein